jgi:SPX domain protein involved in polyphosphate accumulation
MERKTTKYHGNYTIDSSIKERFQLKTKQIPGYCTGEWGIQDDLAHKLERGRVDEKMVQKIKLTADDIQGEILAKTLRPALRTVVRRSAFQNGRDQSLRFSIDTNLHILDEWGKAQGQFCADYTTTPLAITDPVYFPYAILEIKLQKAPPQWVDDLMSSDLIYKAG